MRQGRLSGRPFCFVGFLSTPFVAIDSASEWTSVTRSRRVTGAEVARRGVRQARSHRSKQTHFLTRSMGAGSSRRSPEAISGLIRPPCLRLCADLSDAILEWDMPWDGPPDASHSGHRV